MSFLAINSPDRTEGKAVDKPCSPSISELMKQKPVETYPLVTGVNPSFKLQELCSLKSEPKL